MAAKAAAVSAAGGLVLALVMPGESGTANAEILAAPASADADADAAMSVMGDRSEQQVSRAAARPALAVQAPAVQAPAAVPTFGAMSFTAVEKPPPPPPPPPAPRTTSSSGGSSSGSSGSGSSGNSGNSSSSNSGGGGYDWAAANACSCARGLTQNAMKVLAAVKASFPGMNNIGGVRPDSLPDHPSGRALDFMTTDKGYGDAISNMLISRAGELNIKYIIWYQRIWEPGKGWRGMANRGSATANHMDHVHVSVR